MEFNEALTKVVDIFRDVLDNEDIQLKSETTADDVEDWDSLNHIQLVVAVEKKFGLKFTSHEIQSWNNVGEMINCIIKKKA